MLDKNSLAVLKVLSKLANTDYKVVTIDEISSTISTKHELSVEDIKQIINFLSKQEYINIKFSEDNTYCYSILLKAKQLLEQPTGKKTGKNKSNIVHYIITAVSAFIGTMLALLIFYYI